MLHNVLCRSSGDIVLHCVRERLFSQLPLMAKVTGDGSRLDGGEQPRELSQPVRDITGSVALLQPVSFSTRTLAFALACSPCCYVPV